MKARQTRSLNIKTSKHLDINNGHADLSPMRTTLRIDDDVLRAARSLAATENASLGKVISDLARRGLRPQPASDPSSGIPHFAVSEDVAPLTPEMVRDALDDSA